MEGKPILYVIKDKSQLVLGEIVGRREKEKGMQTITYVRKKERRRTYYYK